MSTTEMSFGGVIAAKAANRVAESAMPWAPVVADPGTIQRRATPHRVTATLLRSCASSTNRLADRLDPRCA
jgi:hypothetical protein